MLHIGGLQCNSNGTDAQVQIASSSIDIQVDIHFFYSSICLQKLADLIGVPLELLRDRITTQRVKVTTRASITVKILKEGDVINNINALVKWMYSSLFNWLVRKINAAHYSMTGSNDDHSYGREGSAKFIGILGECYQYLSVINRSILLLDMI